jgi:hypothetical protein
MVISKVVRKNKKFIEKKEKPEISTDSKATMTELILDFIKDNPNCKLSDMYSYFSDWDTAHIRTKIRRMVETHMVVQRFSVEKSPNIDKLNFN